MLLCIFAVENCILYFKYLHNARRRTFLEVGGHARCIAYSVRGVFFAVLVLVTMMKMDQYHTAANKCLKHTEDERQNCFDGHPRNQSPRWVLSVSKLVVCCCEVIPKNDERVKSSTRLGCPRASLCIIILPTFHALLLLLIRSQFCSMAAAFQSASFDDMRPINCINILC